MPESYILTRIYSEEKLKKEFFCMDELYDYVVANILCDTCKRDYHAKGYYIEDYNEHQYWHRIKNPLETHCAKILKIDLIYTINDKC